MPVPLTLEGPKDAHCWLCGQFGPLRQSHVVPKFVVSWMRRNRGSGSNTRFWRPASGGRQEQDSWKGRLLCAGCEKRLELVETPFANELFSPLQDLDFRDWPLPHGRYLLPFCTSVAWRAAEFSIRALAPASREEFESALERWRAYLLGSETTVGPYKVFLVPIQAILEQPECPDTDAARFYLREAVDLLFPVERLPVVGVKLRGLFVFGYLDSGVPEDALRGWEVPPGEGHLGLPLSSVPRAYPRELWTLIRKQGDRMVEAAMKLSDAQIQRMRPPAN